MPSSRLVFAVLAVLQSASFATAQPTIPNYAAPPDLSAGFDPNAMLGSVPKVKPPENSWAAEALKPKKWSGGIELGLAGSEGNSDVFKIRTGFLTKRAVEGNVLTGDLMYVLSEVGGRLTENKALWVLRDEMQVGTSKWGLLMSEALEFDQFRAFNLRNAMHAGMTRTMYKNDRLEIKSRMGAGTSYDVNTTTMADRWVPEGMMGYDIEFSFTERVRLTSFGDYFPNMGDWRQFRLRVRAAGEFLVVPEYGLVLRAGIQERYDSSPGTGVPNDIDFFTTVLMKY